MQVLRDTWHLFDQELTIVPYRVATKRCSIFWNVFFDEVKCLTLGFFKTDGVVSNSVDQSTTEVMPCVPIIHAFDQFFRDRNSKIRPLCNDVEFRISDDSRNFNDAFTFQIQTRHFEVNPHHTFVGVVHIEPRRIGFLKSA